MEAIKNFMAKVGLGHVSPESLTPRQLSAVQKVVEFTTEDEPKAVDYPYGQYYCYWETVLGEVEGGEVAHVRFYSHPNSHTQISEQIDVVAPTIAQLKPKVNELIRTRMEQYKR